MAWPPKIGLFGKTSNRMSGIPWDKINALSRIERKERFMEAAILAMIPNHTGYRAQDLAQKASDLYEAIGDEVKRTR